MGITPHGKDTLVSEYFKQMMVERLQSAFLTKVERYSPLSRKKVGQIKVLSREDSLTENASIKKRLTLQYVGISKKFVSLQL